MLPRQNGVAVSPDGRARDIRVPQIMLFLKCVQEASPTGPRDSAPPLIRAALDGDARATRQLLQQLDGLNAATACGKTPLHWAVARDARQVVRGLRALSALCGLPLLLDAADVRGSTALHYAAITRNLTLADELLAAGAEVDFRDRSGKTPLMKAAYWDVPALCRRLLDAGADVAATDNSGQTALHVAAAADCAGAVRALLERGARGDVADRQGRTPFLNALRHAPPATALRHWAPTAAWLLLPEPEGQPTEHLDERGCAHHLDETGRSELHWAAANGTDGIVRHLLDLGANSRLRDKEGMTPLMCAIQARNEVTVKILLDVPNCHQVDTDLSGRNALHWAAQCGLWWAVDHLMRVGWTPWTPDAEGRDALMLALTSGDRKTAQAVLQYSAFQQRAAHSGSTALHYAALNDNPDALLAMLQSGADADVVDLMGRTALSCARHRGGAAMVDVLACYASKSLMMPYTN